jgi:hypothetical protein
MAGLYAFLGISSSSMPETKRLTRGYPLWQLSGMETLKTWREAQNLSIPEAATLGGVERATWWRWESGVRRIGLSSVPRIEEITGISRRDLRPDIFSGAH